MNRLSARLTGGLIGLAVTLGSPLALASGPVTVLTNLAVTSAAMPSLPGWSIGGKILSVEPTTPPPVNGDASYALEAQYPSSGPSGMGGPWANFTVPANTESVYIDFWAKMPGAKGGFKFLKIFGAQNDPVGYANTTFMADYTGVDQGAILMAEFGDGTSTANDSQNMIRLNGAGSNLGRSSGIATVLTPQMTYFSSSDWGTAWHHFRVHVKFNSGTTSSNEIPDGEVYVEIDGKVYVDATGLYNRNFQNGPISYIGFFGWAQTDPQPFDIWYDNIVISTGGFVSDPQPSPMPATVN